MPAVRRRSPARTQRVSKDEASDTDNEPETETVAKPSGGGHSKGDNKRSKIIRRLKFGTLMLGMLVAIIAAGHLWTLGLVLLIQAMCFRELVNVRYARRAFADVPLFRTSQWGWFYTCLAYSYSRSFLDPDRSGLVKSRFLAKLLPYNDALALVLYALMLIITVLTLRPGLYKYQMGQLAWTMAITVITVVQVHSFTANILNGLFWFLFPVSLVICNDTMAYFVGMLYGKKIIRRPFLGDLSPNKTWEGFIGGGICTVIFAFFAPRLYTKMPFLICPCQDLSLFTFDTFSLSCTYPSVFLEQSYTLTLISDLSLGRIDAPVVSLLPMQLHALALAAFASLVAPFGGFFASGIKRAYKLDDFASLIPGHGGVYDRVDCQLIMGLATQTYYATFIGPTALLSTGRLLQLALSLSKDDKVALYKSLGTALKAEGLVR